MAYDPQAAQQVCELLSQGETSLRKVCEELGIKPSTFLLWVSKDKELSEQYAHARAIGNAVEFEQITELADEQPNYDDHGKVDPGWVSWQKMRIDARKWSLSKKEPKKYGEKIETTLNGELAVNNKIERIVRKVI